MIERTPALLFTLRGLWYGMVADDGATILPWIQRYAPPGAIPGVPPWMLGLLHVHGTIQPMIDLGQFLHCDQCLLENSARVIFIEYSGLCAGLLVDSATGICLLERLENPRGEDDPIVVARGTTEERDIRVVQATTIMDDIARALQPSQGRA